MPERAHRSIDELLREARSRLRAAQSHDAYREQQAGALLVDIRPQRSREVEGMLPGAVVIERTVLEWRLDPACDSRLPFASRTRYVVLVCNEGYSSSLAAATLLELRPPRNRHRRRLPSLEGGGASHGLSVLLTAICELQVPGSGGCHDTTHRRPDS